MESAIGRYTGLAGLKRNTNLVACHKRKVVIRRIRINTASVKSNAVSCRRSPFGHQLQIQRGGIATLLVGNNHGFEYMVVCCIHILLVSTGSLALFNQLGNRGHHRFSRLRIATLFKGDFLTADTLGKRYIVDTVHAGSLGCETDVECTRTFRQRKVRNSQIPTPYRGRSLGKVYRNGLGPGRTVVAELNLKLGGIPGIVRVILTITLGSEAQTQIPLSTEVQIADREIGIAPKEHVIDARTFVVGHITG